MRLKSKTAFITGGTSGIGLATVEAFVREGAQVALTARDRPKLEAIVQRLAGQAHGFVADAGDDAAMAQALRATAEMAGGIDIVFANAGHYVHSALGSATRGDIEGQMSVVANIFMTVQQSLPYLREGASIILMGSVYSTMGPPGAGAYAASKAAAAAMARSMASELAPRRIRVNTIVPGAVDTPSWPHNQMEPTERERQMQAIGERAPNNRMVTAAEVANAALFLASDDSSGLNASEIVVDGGTTGAIAGSPRYQRGEP